MIHSILPKPREIQVEEGFYQGDPERTEQICDDSLETEGYRLKIGAQAIEMRAKTQAGFYYAEQTLRQLQRQNGGKLPLCEIVDAPVFAHCGFMLDCVRHFFPVADLKRLIEAAARMKLNRFHWHLTDDQGWRIQSPNLSYYLDMCYGVIPLDRAYAYVPYFSEQNRKESTIGVETPIWTEYMPDMKKVGYMAFPHMAAVAETGWCGTEGKDAQSFRRRVQRFLPLISELGIEPAPEAVWNMKKSARIRDALNFWYHALTWADFTDFVKRLRQEKKERDAQ